MIGGKVPLAERVRRGPEELVPPLQQDLLGEVGAALSGQRAGEPAMSDGVESAALGT